MSAFAGVQAAPRDPILGLNEQFAADTRTEKVNLGVGVYFDENGRMPLLNCVRTAEERLAQNLKPHAYLPIDGLPAYTAAVKKLVFGADSALLADKRVATVQGLGGTGGLKIGADFLRQLNPNAKALVSDPSWANHRALLTRAGFEVGTYRYYDAEKHGVDFDGMIADLKSAAPGTVIVLHACCHNPTGYDLTPAQWDTVLATVRERQLMPFLDMAYQGFAHGLSQDGAAVGKFAASGLSFLVATSFSKSFSLYGERIGALSVVCASADEAARVLSQLKVTVRTNYSNPPTHGAAIVAEVLDDEKLRNQWENELGAMRERIRTMREALVKGLKAAGVRRDMSFITEQVGMFSYSGLNKEQMLKLRSDFGIYGTDAGRICVAALNSKNIDYVCRCIAEVL